MTNEKYPCGKKVDKDFPEIGLCQHCLDHRSTCESVVACKECDQIEEYVAQIKKNASSS